MKRSHRVYDTVKRFLDVVAASVLLVLLSPVFAITALLVRVRLGSPVIFAQKRPGRGARVFTVHKFRSMRLASSGTSTLDAVGSDSERLDTFGRALRASSLDELPELYDVLVGNMSFVGPRPLLVEYLDRYNGQQARRHEVRPGITGWAQVNGRNAVPWPERLAMDVWYVDNRSFALDLRILARTVATVLRREGVSASDGAAMDVFDPGPPYPHEEES